MKKGSVFGIVCAFIALFFLALVAIFVTYEAGDTLFNDEQPTAVKQADDLLATLHQPVIEDSSSVAVEPASEIDMTDKSKEKSKEFSKISQADLPAASSEPSYIWVGDSRTLGMRDAMENSDIYIGAAGEGYYWFIEEGLKELESTLEKYPTLPVIFNFGVNDCSNMDNYLSLYKAIVQDHPTNKFYFLGIYPVDPEATEYVTNEEIAEFNAQLKESYPDTFIDGYTFLLANEIQTIDGIHYSQDASRELYAFTTKSIK